METHVANPVIPALRELYNESPVAREILASFSDWENRKVTSVKRIHRRIVRRGSLLDRAQVANFLQRLHDIGVGEFIGGENERRPRFVWGFPILDLPRVASGEAWELQPLQDTDAVNGSAHETDDHEIEDRESGDHDDHEDEDLGRELPGHDAPVLKHSYRLRGSYVVKLRLPMDLTATEAGRLADYIRTLPFGS